MAAPLFPIEKLQERYATLPPAVRAILDSEDIGEQVDRISRNHELLLDQSDILAQEITYTILGLRRPGDFVRAIEERMRLKHFIAYQIGMEVEDVVFKPIREHLATTHDDNEYTPLTNTTSAPLTPAAAIARQDTVEEHTEEHHDLESADDLLAEIENADDLPALTTPTVPIAKISQNMTSTHSSSLPPKAAPVTPAYVPPTPRPAQSFVPPAQPVTTPVVKPLVPPVQQVMPQSASAASAIPKPPMSNVLKTTAPVTPPGPGTLNLKSTPPAKPSFIAQEVGIKPQTPPAAPKKYVSDPYREPIN